MDLDARVSKHAHAIGSRSRRLHRAGDQRATAFADGSGANLKQDMCRSRICVEAGHVPKQDWRSNGAGGQPMGQRDKASVPAWVRP